MFGKVFCVLSVAFSIVTEDVNGVINTNYESCGATDLSIYQNKVHQGQWPFVASIYHVKNYKINFLCGGTIISKFAVITG